MTPLTDHRGYPSIRITGTYDFHWCYSADTAILHHVLARGTRVDELTHDQGGLNQSQC